MKAPLLYRVASGLLLLFAIGHTMGFRRVDPRWGMDSLIASLRAMRFEVQGASRTYWDFYVGFGLFVTVLLVFAALLTWQLGGLSQDALKGMPIVTWGLVVCFAAVTLLSGRYFFMAPLVFSAVITLCLGAAAWAASRS